MTSQPSMGAHGIPGWFGFAEVYDLAAQRFPRGRFVEIGCWLGCSTAHLGLKVKEHAGTVYAVDTWKGSYDQPDLCQWAQEKDIYAGFIANMARLELLGDPVCPIRMGSVKAAALFADGSLDFVFIDGCHHYNAIRADIVAWRPKVRPGGMLAGDDYDSNAHPDVRRAVHEMLGQVRQVGWSWVYEVK